MFNNDVMAPWELLQKQMIWQQLSFVHNLKVLDFGSGAGITANYFAADNEVLAVETDEEMINGRVNDNQYNQIKGGLEVLKELEADSFDVILCHNVLEYAEERIEIIKEFERLLKDNGFLSIVKHNRAGRVMQMVVLLNNFEHAILMSIKLLHFFIILFCKRKLKDNYYENCKQKIIT